MRAETFSGLGGRPVAELAPLEYCYALDAATALLTDFDPRRIARKCGQPELEAELGQRLGQRGPTDPTSPQAGLWVEPQHRDWQRDLAFFQQTLPSAAPLLIVASQPLARFVSERRQWSGQPSGVKWSGHWRLRRALRKAGFTVGELHGLHTGLSIGLNVLAAQLDRRGRPDLADRMRFSARLHYRTDAQTAWLSTVALLVAVKG